MSSYMGIYHFGFCYKKYRNESASPLNQSNNEIMQKALEDLRVLGGWSANSIMPSYYAKRFIVDSANLMNLQRISQEL